MESRDTILQNINKLYDEYMAQISQGKMVKDGIFTGKTKGLLIKKPEGRGLMFYTSSKIIVSGQFENGKVFGTYGEVRKDEYYAMYSISGGQISNISMKRILPRGYFIGKEDYFTNEMDGDYYDNSGLVVSGHFDTFNVVALHNAENSLPRFTTKDPKALTLKYPDGSSYRGCLYAGKKSGRGLFVEKEGVFTGADWENDKPVKIYQSAGGGKAVGVKFNGYTYDGEIDENGKFKGKGKVTFDDGDTLEGEFDGDLCKGVRTIHRENGNYYTIEGSFIKGRTQGDAKETFYVKGLKTPVSISFKADDGKVVDGTYKYDKNPYGLKVVSYKNGKFDGKCDCINDDGSLTLGANYENGVVDGTFKLVLPDGTSYEQVFEKGIIKKGYKSYSSGNHFEGEFDKNGLCLKGTYYFADGERFVGEFVNGRRHKGINYFTNGDRFEGEYYENDHPKKGTRYYANGDRFEGEFANGTRLNGTYYVANGNYFVGDFIDGKRHKGIYYFANGSRYEGEYDENEQRKKGKIYYTSGEHFEGEFKNGNMYYGTYYYSDGGRFEGYFEENGDNLKGTSYLASGDRFEGEYKNGDFYKGTYTFVSGEKFVGEFRNGDRYKGVNYSEYGEKQKIDNSRGR